MVGAVGHHLPALVGHVHIQVLHGRGELHDIQLHTCKLVAQLRERSPRLLPAFVTYSLQQQLGRGLGMRLRLMAFKAAKLMQ